jgi:hypothetical protein
MRPARANRQKEWNSMKNVLIATMIALLTSPAWAGGTSIRGNLVALAQRCDFNNPCEAGSCQEGGAACGTNSDCNICGAGSLLPCDSDADCFRGAVSPKSKIQLSGSGELKGSLSGVVDGNGAAVTTDGVVGSADDHLLLLVLNNVDGNTASLSVKVDFKNGKAKVAADLSAYMVGEGPIVVTYALLFTPPNVPAACPGTNSPADLLAREGDEDCGTGLPLAAMGLLPGQ